MTFVGMSIYSYEAIGIVMPIYQTMKNKKNFNFINSLCIFLATTIYGAFGFVGYLAFGDNFKNRPNNY